MRRQLIALALPVITGALLVLAGTAALAGGGGCFQPDTQGAGTVVNITARCFSPTILYVQPGDKVTWRNDDGMTHVVAGSFSGWGNPTNLAVGESMTHHFPTAGIYP
jgi:plastocyanin